LFNTELIAMKTMLLIASAAVLALAPANAEPGTKTVVVDGPKFDSTRTTVRDKAAGTLTRETDVVRARDGATASSNYSRTRTDTGVSVSGSQTGFAGRTRSYDYNRTRTETGSTTTGTATGRDGQTYALSGNRTKTATGFTANQNIVNSDGRTVYNRDISVSRSGGNVTRSVDVTRAKGFHKPQGVGRGIRGARRR
jgi:hypothetical protein